ncbi:MAG: hypothetical protein H7301_01155 [Cryobacterium sp.]|nr:hypothetical protein [Oligoflexia bacterium]
MFFIGDGKTTGGAVQKFVVPPGATRLFFTIHNNWEWNKNAGKIYVNITSQLP